ncbi:3-hydroxyisobutyrate dehydrogenase [Amaricoccus macauensis]|uniref:L-threonate dehydrogenase n=1 Tax=Amaricoccus macauensis TaxID=57001 RepID=A0A840SWL2_9RHOB|nr:L-threonate dehydrogenase [Amaricoccus macauensis]MBB5223531.1 3-hydroxyisobutyrate dehydrogenase [Amaricoccus macauensis]
MSDVGETPAIRVAVIGLGSMGLGMAESLLRAGFAVSGCDLAQPALDRLAMAGGRPCTTPAEAAEGAAVIVVVVVNAAQTSDVLFGRDGAVPVAPAGAVVVSSATMAPADAEALARRCEDAGLLFLDAPISGGAKRAAEGELTVMASGAETAFAKAGPVLEAVAVKVHRLGDRAGIGASVKMVNQLLAGVHIAAACEAITLAGKLGLDLDTVYEVITGSAGNSWMFENRIPHVLAGDYTPLSSVEIFVKDLGIIQDMARTERYPAPVAAAALQMYLAAAGSGMGRDDDASLARVYARLSGVSLPGDA